jgi:two-component system phosphate regulon sensor histidine kinase PhoR
VFFNIIDNAINYNREGGSVSIAASDGARDISITISDTGIGIPERDVPRIFERFYRVDQSRSRETGGTGLGLSIVKHAAELLNWNIRVASGGDGTSFTVVIGKTFA